MTTVETTTVWTVERALALGRDEFIELFKTLPAAAFAEMDGEYRGYAHFGDTVESRKAVVEAMYNEQSVNGYWLGKSFKAMGATRGEGYNLWRRPGGTVARNLRYGTHPGASLIDGRPALVITYSTFNNGAGRADLIDDIRTLADGVYLGLSTARAADGGRTAPGPFVLGRRRGPWVGVDDEVAETR